MKSTNINTVTNWTAIWILFLSGCTLALHIGKLPVALPLLVKEFNMTLAQSGNLVSIYSVLIASGGLLCGMFVARLGYVRFAVIGVAMCLIGSFAGAYASSVFTLMLSRAIEGLGWVMSVIALPVIISTISADKDRPVVMGLWGAFMSVGAATMLLIAPELQIVGGWRLSWFVAGSLSGIGAVAVMMVCHRQREALMRLRPAAGISARTGATKLSVILVDVRKRHSLAICFCFFGYSVQYISVTSFLPTLLVQDSAMALASASHWTALILLPNAIGNISAGWFINRGLKRSTILGYAALTLGILSLVTLSVDDTSIRIVAALLMTGVGGIIPGTLFSTAALVASTAAGVGVIIGFMLTGAGIGQLFGPVLVTRVVEWSGHWYTGGLLCLAAGMLGAYFARWLSDISAVTR